MRILFLALHDRGVSPGQRYRFEAFEPYFRSCGAEVAYASVLSPADTRDFYGRVGVGRKARIALKALLRRLRSLTARCDVVFVQREAFFLFDAWSEWLASLRAPLVFDFDDAIWMYSVSPENARFAWLKNVEKVPRIVRLARSVFAGNEYLAAWARAHNPRVHVVPTCVDTDWFRPQEALREPSVVTVGWSGSRSTLPQIEPIIPALIRVQRELGPRVRFRLMGLPDLQIPELGLRGETWTPDAELRMLQASSIGIMPLPDDEWTKGKCGLKALVSMASGAAVVASPVGVATTIVRDGENGLLASTEDEWVAALVRLVRDEPLRSRLGRAGRATVEAGYAVRGWREPIFRLLAEAASGR